METKTYKVVGGTSYDVRTPDSLVELLEKCRVARKRVRLTYGSTDTGVSWAEGIPFRGYIGRSTGDSKIPLLVANSRSTGGEAILDYCIIQVVESAGGKVLWTHPNFRTHPVTRAR